jgi:hypothetical protein
MIIATGEPAALTQKERPPWVAEWLDARAAREEKSASRATEKSSVPVDEKAAAKRRQQRESRVAEGVVLLRQNLLDLVREGLAAPAARDPSTWENLARRMIDCQAPGLAGNLRHIGDTILRDPQVDTELPLELGRLYLLLHTISHAAGHPDAAVRSEALAQIGGRSGNAGSAAENLDDDWFVAGRRVEERDRLITSATWLLGSRSGRWARVLRFAPVPQTVVEPWPLGSTVKTTLSFQPGLFPMRATPMHDGHAAMTPVPQCHEPHIEGLLDRFAAALAANPFLRSIPFLMPLFPAATPGYLSDSNNVALPWDSTTGGALRVDCICGGAPAVMCGEWDGRAIRLLSILDGDVWFPLTPQQA